VFHWTTRVSPASRKQALPIVDVTKIVICYQGDLSMKTPVSDGDTFFP
jgi:hypothetical protein